MKTTRYYNKYLSLYGPHFTKHLCEFAVSLMEKGDAPITPFTKSEIDEKLKAVQISLEYNKFYDYIYVANMCKADFLGEAVPNDDLHLCKYIKGAIDDPDGYDGQIFYRWLSDIEGMRIPVDWSEFV